MFNVGLGEMIFILLIALLVFGPERLPEIARQAGRFFAQLRGMSDEIQRAIMSETEPIKRSFDETRQEIESTATPISEIRKEVDSTLSTVNSIGKKEPPNTVPTGTITSREELGAVEEVEPEPVEDVEPEPVEEEQRSAGAEDGDGNTGS